MRVLVTVKLKTTSGGIENTLIKTIPALAAVGVDVAVLSANGGRMARELRDAGVEVFLPKKDLLDVRGSDRDQWLKTIKEVADSYQPDIFYPTQTDAIISTLEVAGGKPVVAALHSRLFDWISAEDKDKLARDLRKLHSLHATGYVLAEQLRSLGADRIVNIFSPVVPLKQRANPRAQIDDPQIVFVGRPDTRKALDVLLRSMPRLLEHLPALRLSVIGHDGQTEREYGGGRDRPLAQELGVDEAISWLGPQSNRFVIDKMLDSDLLVSSSRHEALPGVILEAHSLALPVVATSVSLEAMNWGDAGLVVPRENPFLLSEAIMADLRDSNRVERGKRNREWVYSHYSLDRLVDILQQDFTRVLDA